MLISPCNCSGEGILMSQVKVKENESLESALKRFKRQTSRDGVIQEVRKREHYEKPSVKRRRSLRQLANASTNKYLHCTIVHLKAVGMVSRRFFRSF